MEQIIIRTDAYDLAQKLGVENWAHWNCEPSKFEWFYATQEIAYIFSGRVTVTTATDAVEIGPEMLVSFPKGLSCTWEVHETIKKAYAFDVNINQ